MNNGWHWIFVSIQMMGWNLMRYVEESETERHEMEESDQFGHCK